MTQVIHLEKADGSLACRVRREPDSQVTTEPAAVTCPFCRGKKGDAAVRRCEVCFRVGGHHDTVPHVNRRKPDNCTCGHERDAHGWALPCGCRACPCAGFAGGGT
jgi:hypothetical protein